MRFLWLIISTLLIVGALVACSPSPAPSADSASAAASQPSNSSSTANAEPKPTIKIESQDDFFRPDKVTVMVGTQVTWTNTGKKNHTVTSGNTFDMDLKPGQSFSFTFDKAGTYQYYCVTHSESEHEGMVGTITVTEKK